MDENGIIGLKEAVQDDDSEGGGALSWGSEGDPPTPAEDHLQDQSFHLSKLQDSLSPADDSHALSVYDLGERTPHSEGSGTEEEDRSWIIHRLTETDPQMDLTDEEREEEEEGEEDEEDFSGNSDPGGCSDSLCSDTEESRDGHCWRGSPKLPQGEGEDPSLVGCLQEDDVDDNAAVVYTPEHSGDSQGDGNEGSRLRDTLTALSTSPPLRPSLTAGGHRDRLTWHSSNPAHLQLLHLGTEEPAAGAGFEGLAESLTESCSSLQSPASTAGQSGGDGSPNALTSTPASPPPRLRQERCPGSGVEEADDEEEEEQEEEEEDRRPHEGATMTNPPPLLPQKLKTKHHHAPHEAPPSLPPQHAREGRSSPLDSAPCRTATPRVRRGHSALGEGSPKPSGASPARSSQDSGRYGKGQLSHPLPDFSKVEPRVRFPKEGYRPPRSKGRPRKKGPGSEPPLVFKSPADIVREVLLSSADAPAAPAAPSPPAGPLRPPNTTLPQEFRSPQQATALVHQLQEDYRRLLTKYAEAENTIDRLRLEAKVGLYSDPPKPSHPVQSGTLHMGSKVVTLTFPQAQRAELDPSAVSHLSVRPDPGENGTSPAFPSDAAFSAPCSLGSGFGEQLTQALSTQAERFQMQFESFEELLRREKLKPCEQLKALSRLVQGQDSLERGYLGAREKHRLLQLQGGDVGPFDPDRELEGEIFRSGMRLEELKERVQQAVPVQPDSAARPSPPPPPGLDTTISPLRTGAPTPHPENPAFSVGMAVTSVSGGSEGEEERSREEELPRPCWMLRHRRQQQESDLSHLLDSSLNLGEVPHLLDFGQGEGFPNSAAAHAFSPQNYGIPMEPRRTERDGRTVAQLPPGGAKEAFLTSPPGHTGLPHEPLPRSPAFPRQRGQELKGVGVKSHSSSMASVGESASSEGRASHLQNAFRTAPLQDGILSPETDSGFVGSESSHLTVAMHGPVQEGARASHSAALGEGGETRLPVSAQSRPSSALQGHTLQDSSRVAPGDAGGPRLGGRGGRPARGPSAASSPRPWPSSVSSECDPESDRAHGLSEGEEVGHGARHTQTANQQPRHQRSPSPTVLRHYSDPVGVHGSEQPTSRHQALRSLQTEVSRLREQLEGSLRRTGHSLSTTVPPAGLGDPLRSQHSSTPYSRITQHQAGNERAEEVEEEEEEEDGETEQRERSAEAPRLIPRRRPSVPRLKPELDITSDSDHAQCASKSHFARGIPESSATQGGRRRRARAEAVKHTGPYTGQQWSFTPSGGRGEGGAEREGRSFLRPHDTSHGTAEQPSGKGRAGGVSTTHPSHPHSGRRPRPQGSRLGRDRMRPERGSGSTPRSAQPIGSPHRGVFMAAPPPPVLGSVSLVQCVPVCPSVLYYSTPSPVSMATPPYPQPFYLSLGGGAEGGGVNPAEQSLSRSLSRAIEAAHCMRAASRRMARSLSTALLHQGAPSQTCPH